MKQRHFTVFNQFLFGFQLSFKIRLFAILQFRSFIQIIIAFCKFDFLI